MSLTPLDAMIESSENTDSEEGSGVDDNAQNKWISELLRKYLLKYVRDFLAKRKDGIPSPVTSTININILDGNGNSKNNPDVNSLIHRSDPEQIMTTYSEQDDLEEKAMNNLRELDIIDIDITEETALGDDRITYLSRILSVAVNYSVAGASHFLEWIVKVPSKFFDERNLARETLVYLREVSFYMNILENIKMWLEHNCTPPSSDSQRILLNVPTCYYAYFQESNNDFDPEIYEFPNSEYTLILEDLRAQGFGKRHYSMGLTVEEATEAVREIAKFHVISWAMEQHSHEENLRWPNLLMWEDLHKIALTMVQQGFMHLRGFRTHQLKDSTQIRQVDRLLALESRLPNILEGLLKPLPPPAVTSLIHMDLWTDNLLFRETIESNQMETNEGHGEQVEGATQEVDMELDCMILDWQMVSYGRITHDLALLIMTSLDAQTRRTQAMSLLKFYFETFERIAKCFKLEVPFEFMDFVDQYRSSCLLATLLSVGRMDLIVSEQSTLVRFFNALEDLQDEDLI
ncbi:unnamed protein product [Orchesella dallaii]|uniref:CHK kinase-like domain-containing protein n=1 Tax=Orchesella dallaii TaxID=48710 RepID=A0ABP1PR91_9HEXA